MGQAATLLAEAKKRQCASLVIYAALEMRMAIEQLLFSIVVVAKGGIDDATLQKCRKKDGLFRVVDEVASEYSRRCKFSNALASFYPNVPQTAEWYVRTLRRFYTALSELCHSQLVIRNMRASPEPWDERVAMLKEVYEFLAGGLRKGTGVLLFNGANSHVIDLWNKYSTGQITLDDVRRRWALIKPLLDHDAFK